MKRTIFLLLTFSAFLASCSNEDLAGGASVSESTSASITAYVADNYPATSIISTMVNGSTVTATLNTGEELSFTSNGTLIAYSNNYSAGLNADSIIITDSTAMDSIHNDSIGKPRHDDLGGKGGHGGHGGKMGGGHGNGKPEQPGQGGNLGDNTHMGGNHGHERHFKNEIAVDSLSSEINTYLSENYSGFAVIHAEIDTICQGIVTEVMVCLTTTEPVKLVFDAAGAFLMKAERIHFTDVPEEVSAALKAYYSTYKVKNRGELYTWADGSLQYKVFMSINSRRKSVTFNADGTVACEK